MSDENDHRACVRALLERAGHGPPPERRVLVLEQGFAVLWRRAHRTLGDVTLAAIMDRVLYDGAERHPSLAALEIGVSGLSNKALRDKAGGFREGELVEGLQFVLVEFLTVLGNLTADILTPSLHEELSRLVPDLAPRELESEHRKP